MKKYHGIYIIEDISMDIIKDMINMMDISKDIMIMDISEEMMEDI